MPGSVYLANDTVMLRTIEEEDLPFLRDTINDPAVRRYLPNRSPINLAQERDFFESVICSDEDINLLICADGAAVGTIGLHPATAVSGSGEIGLFLAPDYWKNGYGTAAASLLTTWAFTERRFHRICARVLDGNVGSQRIWEKLGYRHEAIHREADFNEGAYVDVHWYAILSDEWVASNAE